MTRQTTQEPARQPQEPAVSASDREKYLAWADYCRQHGVPAQALQNTAEALPVDSAKGGTADEVR